MGTGNHFLPQAGREKAKRFQTCLKRASEHPGEKEIHDLRVSIRRRMSFLDVANSLSGKEVSRREEKRLREMMKPLGKLRDAQVKIEWMKKITPTGDEGTRLYALSVLGDAQKQEARVRELLKDASRRRSSARPPKQVFPALREEVLAKKAAALLAARKRKVESFREGAREETNAESLHRMRLAFKKYRYCAEVLAPLFPRADAKTMRRLHAFQTLLGNLHDLDVLMEEAETFHRRILAAGDEMILLPRLRRIRRKEFLRLAPLLASPDLFSRRVFGSEFTS